MPPHCGQEAPEPKLSPNYELAAGCRDLGLLGEPAGLALVVMLMVTESWLNAVAGNERRRSLLAVHMILNYVALGSRPAVLRLASVDGLVTPPGCTQRRASPGIDSRFPMPTTWPTGADCWPPAPAPSPARAALLARGPTVARAIAAREMGARQETAGRRNFEHTEIGLQQ